MARTPTPALDSPAFNLAAVTSVTGPRVEIENADGWAGGTSSLMAAAVVAAALRGATTAGTC